MHVIAETIPFNLNCDSRQFLFQLILCALATSLTARLNSMEKKFTIQALNIFSASIHCINSPSPAQA